MFSLRFTPMFSPPGHHMALLVPTQPFSLPVAYDPGFTPVVVRIALMHGPHGLPHSCCRHSSAVYAVQHCTELGCISGPTHCFPLHQYVLRPLDLLPVFPTTVLPVHHCFVLYLDLLSVKPLPIGPVLQFWWQSFCAYFCLSFSFTFLHPVLPGLVFLFCLAPRTFCLLQWTGALRAVHFTGTS